MRNKQTNKHTAPLCPFTAALFSNKLEIELELELELMNALLFSLLFSLIVHYVHWLVLGTHHRAAPRLRSESSPPSRLLSEWRRRNGPRSRFEYMYLSSHGAKTQKQETPPPPAPARILNRPTQHTCHKGEQKAAGNIQVRFDMPQGRAESCRQYTSAVCGFKFCQSLRCGLDLNAEISGA